MFLDPKKYGLHSRVVLNEKSENEIVIVIHRKSRFIMKDGERILDQAKKIQMKENKRISVETSAPICSKTKKFLNKKGIEIAQKEL